jgi:flagellar basal body-associated protein FliL
MLTGNKPYNADNTFALAYKHATEPIPVLPDHLSGYQNILNQLLAKRPEDRFDTAEDFAIALETLQLELTPSGIQAQIDAADATQIRPSGVTPKTASSRTGEPEQTERRSNKMIIGLVAALVLLIGAAAVYFAIGKKSSPDPVVSDRQAPEQVPVTPSTTVSPVSPSPVGVTEPTSTITPPPDNTTTPEPVTATETPIVTMTPPDPTSTVEQPENNADQVIAVRYLQQVQRLLDEDAWEEGLEQIEAGLQEVPDNEELLALRSEMRALLSSESQEARKQRQINLGRLRLVKRYQETAQQLMQQGKLQESLQEIQKGLIIWPGDDSLLELRDEVEALIRKNE